RERGDGLFLVVFPDLEILNGKIPDVTALFVGHHSVDKNQSCLRLDQGSFACGGLGRLLSTRRQNRSYGSNASQPKNRSSKNLPMDSHTLPPQRFTESGPHRSPQKPTALPHPAPPTVPSSCPVSHRSWF